METRILIPGVYVSTRTRKREKENGKKGTEIRKQKLEDGKLGKS
jgi:hypothetical protein